MTLGSKISSLRNAVPLSQEELAEKVGVPLELITKWERNIQEPNKEYRQQLADVFSVPLEDLVAEDDDDCVIFQDHKEERPNNKRLCKKFTLLFLGLGLILFLSIPILGIFALLPAFLATGYGFQFFYRWKPLIPLYQKIIAPILYLLFVVAMCYAETILLVILLLK